MLDTMVKQKGKIARLDIDFYELRKQLAFDKKMTQMDFDKELAKMLKERGRRIIF